MELNTLTAISPVDGRYASKITELRPLFSEYALLRYRTLVEIRWLQQLASCPQIKEVPALSNNAEQALEAIIKNFSIADANTIKKYEQNTNHDVKAVEYFIKHKFQQQPELAKLTGFIHFACTSEDINNLAYALMLQQTRAQLLVPQMSQVIKTIHGLAIKTANQTMLARTHGQPASPTTVGKELINIVQRLNLHYQALQQTILRGKFNGAVGNFNAHLIAYPEVNWLLLSQQLVESLNLTWNPYTTQIEPHDYIAELLHAIIRFNNVLIDFNRDIWGYISLNYFKQQTIASEVGSSTMPHKVNPIDFENSEGNLGLANANMQFLSEKLLISRWQRDLVDSTLLRNLGVAFAHTLIAYQNCVKGLNKLAINPEPINDDLSAHPEILAEAIQTIMRRFNIEQPYEKLKDFTRGKKVDHKCLLEFINQLDLPASVKQQLKDLTPAQYKGNAVTMTERLEDLY